MITTLLKLVVKRELAETLLARDKINSFQTER